MDGEESALLPLPQLKPALRAGLSTPHHSGTEVPQRLLMRLRRGRLCQGRRTRAQGTDSRLCGPGRASAPSSRRFRPSAHDSTRKPRAPLRAAQIIARTSGPFPRLTKRARGTVTLRAPPRPADVCWTSAQPPWELRGGFVSAKWVGATSLSLAPAQSARCLGRREKGIPLLLGAARLCCAEAGASGTFRAFWP